MKLNNINPLWLSLGWIGAGLGLMAWSVTTLPIVREPFATGSPEERVVQLYDELLQRSPTSEEYRRDVSAMASGQWDEEHLRRRIMSSDEKMRRVKTQQDDVVPDLSRVVHDKVVLTEVDALYQGARGTPTPPKMMLPLRDLYVRTDFDGPTMDAFLRAPGYKNYEDDLLHTERLDRKKVMDRLDASFDLNALAVRTLPGSVLPGTVNDPTVVRANQTITPPYNVQKPFQMEQASMMSSMSFATKPMPGGMDDPAVRRPTANPALRTPQVEASIADRIARLEERRSAYSRGDISDVTLRPSLPTVVVRQSLGL